MVAGLGALGPRNIALLIIACLSLVFAFSFLLAAVFTFASYDQRPLDRNTDRMLSLAAWFGGGTFIHVFAVTRYWPQCQLGRRLFCVGLVCGFVAALCGYLSARGV